MAYGAALKRGFQIAGRIDKKYNINKIFIDKYAPPHWKPGLRRVIDIAGTLSGGYGIYGLISQYMDDEIEDGTFQQTSTYKQPETYRGRPGRSRSKRQSQQRFDKSCRLAGFSKRKRSRNRFYR